MSPKKGAELVSLLDSTLPINTLAQVALMSIRNGEINTFKKEKCDSRI